MSKPRNWTEPSERVQFKTQRLLVLLEELAVHHFPVVFDDVYRAMNDRFGICSRTTQRDLAVLELLGLVQERREDTGAKTFEINRRNALLASIAKRMSFKTHVSSMADLSRGTK